MPTRSGKIYSAYETKCIGCIEDQPNQEAHYKSWHPDGCIDDDSQSESDSIRYANFDESDEDMEY